MAKLVVRAAEPSAGGHGVSPVIAAPGAGGWIVTVPAGTVVAVVVDPEASLPLAATTLLSLLLLPPVRRATTKIATTSSTMTIAKLRMVRSRVARC